MKHSIFAHTTVILLLNAHFVHAAPAHSNDIDYDDNGSRGGSFGGARGNLFRSNTNQMDYNSLFSHVKDFFMYLPVMMTTFKESMAGFPKFAEGVRILTSKSGRREGPDDSTER